MIKAVIFDLDDTLYNEIEYCKSGFWAIAKYLSQETLKGSPEHFFTVLWQKFEISNQNVFNNALDELSIEHDQDFIRKLVDIYRNHTPVITLPEDSREILEILKTKYKLGLITDGFLPAQEMKVQALGIEIYFDSIIYTESLGRNHWKPDPLSFQITLQKLHLEPENAIYVADNEQKDFIAPNKMQMKTVQLIRNNKIHKKTAENTLAKANEIIKNLSELPKILQKL